MTKHMPILHTCRDSRGLRVQWTAAEMGLDLDVRFLPFPPRRRAEEYLEINPLGTVPFLIDGDVTMSESSAICHYLAVRYGPTPLLVGPDEPEFGEMLDFLHHADATLTFPQTVYMRFALFEPERGLAEAGEAYARWFAARLIKIEQRLADREYLCAGRFTLADVAVGYALFLARRVGLGDRLPPAVNHYLDRITARPAFIAARAAGGETPSALG